MGAEGIKAANFPKEKEKDTCTGAFICDLQTTCVIHGYMDSFCSKSNLGLSVIGISNFGITPGIQWLLLNCCDISFFQHAEERRRNVVSVLVMYHGLVICHDYYRDSWCYYRLLHVLQHAQGFYSKILQFYFSLHDPCSLYSVHNAMSCIELSAVVLLIISILYILTVYILM